MRENHPAPEYSIVLRPTPPIALLAASSTARTSFTSCAVARVGASTNASTIKLATTEDTEGTEVFPLNEFFLCVLCVLCVLRGGDFLRVLICPRYFPKSCTRSKYLLFSLQMYSRSSVSGWYASG